MGTLSQLNKAEADIVGAKMDDEGIIPEELDNLIKDLLSQGRKLNIYIQFRISKSNWFHNAFIKTRKST